MKTIMKTIEEIKDSIRIGFGKSKMYKRSVWNNAVKVMEFLSDTTKEVTRTYNGDGLEKYIPAVELTDEQVTIWALSYKRSLGLPIYVHEAVPELERIARELGVKPCDGIVVTEYFNRHPEERNN